MKTLILAAVLLSAGTAAVAQVGVSVTVGQPGFYGRLDIGDYPAPQLIYAQPVIVQRPQYYAGHPIYLRVPPGYEKHWKKHCAAYGACGRPVYFVREDWYQNEYVPHQHHREGNGNGHENGQGNGNGHDKGHGDDHGHDHD